MLPIDTEYDSATPEPGYEGLSVAELMEVIDEEWREYHYYEEQENRWSEFPFHNSWNFGPY